MFWIGTSQILNFTRPGNGAPTEDIRKKRFTEYQLDRRVIRGHWPLRLIHSPMFRSQSSMNLDQLDQYMGGGGAGGMNR